jgi:hypothetical protein
LIVVFNLAYRKTFEKKITWQKKHTQKKSNTEMPSRKDIVDPEVRRRLPQPLVYAGLPLFVCA